MRTTANARYATSTLGTCTYMMRCTLPWAASRGATTKPITRPATRPSITNHPNVRFIGSPLEDRVERQHAHGHVHGVGGGKQLQPVRDRGQALAGEHRLRRLHGPEEHRDEDGQQQYGEEQLACAHLRGHRGEERADRGEADGAEHDHAGERREVAADVEIEEHAEQHEHDRLDQQHQQQVAGELAEVDGRLVPGRQEQSFPAVVITLGEERAPQTHQPAQDEAQPQQSRQRVGHALAIAAERELEDEEQQEREEEERVERLRGAPLRGRILPEDDPGPTGVDHASSSAWASYSRRTSSGDSVAAGVSRATVPPARMTMRSAMPRPRPKLCVVSKTEPPPALNAARYSSTHFPACWSSPANGSSRRITRGRPSVSRARASRRFIPTENVRTRAWAKRSRSTAVNATRSVSAFTGRPLSVVQNLRFSSAVKSSYTHAPWATKPTHSRTRSACLTQS